MKDNAKITPYLCPLLCMELNHYELFCRRPTVDSHECYSVAFFNPFNFCLYFFVQALTKVKIELLKNHDFLPW